MDTVVTAMKTLFTMTTKETPRFESQGGSPRESLALQNIQVCCSLGSVAAETHIPGETKDGPGVHVRSASAVGQGKGRRTARLRQCKR
jgi:hypothetical protein